MKKIFVVAIALTLLLVGCGHHSTVKTEADFNNGVADLGQFLKSGSLTTNISITHENVEVQIEKGILAPNRITIETVSVQNPDNATVLMAYDIQPSGTVFNEPITITMSYSNISGVDAKFLEIAYNSDGKWIGIPSTVDTTKKIVTGTVNHFTVFGLMMPNSSETTTTPEPSPTVEPSPTATVVTIPSDTPEPTIVPQPTDTPQPTHTPQPTVTPEPIPTVVYIPFAVWSPYVSVEPITATTVSLHPNESVILTYKIYNWYNSDVVCSLNYSVSPLDNGITISGPSSIIAISRSYVYVNVTVSADNSVVPMDYVIGINFEGN
jgi:uncharacterized protein YcfL